jgi:hypothetical protein
MLLAAFSFVFEEVPTWLQESWILESKWRYYYINCEMTWPSFVGQCRKVTMFFFGFKGSVVAIKGK